MNELAISASMEIGVMLEAVASDIREHFYSAKRRDFPTIMVEFSRTSLISCDIWGYVALQMYRSAKERYETTSFHGLGSGFGGHRGRVRRRRGARSRRPERSR